MNNLFKKLQKKRLVVGVFAILLGAALGSLLEHAHVANIGSILKWSAGLGLFTVLWLHGKSFFSTDNLGWYYTRLYGAGFGMIYTSLVFLLFVNFYAGQHNESFNIVAYTTVLSTIIYNFITNNYHGIEKEHLIARSLLERQLEKDAIEKAKRGEMQDNSKV